MPNGASHMSKKDKSKHELLVKIARNRGFYWPSNEIYGGVAGFYDFGPLGVRLKLKIMGLWRRMFIYNQDLPIVEIETPIINPRIVFKASGHEDNFTDPITECKKCGKLYRVDHLIEETLDLKVEGLSMDELWEIMKKHGIKCPIDNGELTKPKPALLLFKTEIGPYKGSSGYIRPETAQGMFVSFKHVFSALREKFPLGIAQIGKVGRNEISPRQGLIRLREFTIMEIEFFFDPDKAWTEAKSFLEGLLDEKLSIISADMKVKGVEEPETSTLRDFLERKVIVNPWLGYWMAVGNKFLKQLGIPEYRIRLYLRNSFDILFGEYPPSLYSIIFLEIFFIAQSQYGKSLHPQLKNSKRRDSTIFISFGFVTASRTSPEKSFALFNSRVL